MEQNQHCVLIAEDHDGLRYAMAKTLSSRGYCVIEACNGRQAMKRQSEYDGIIHILITDIVMPEMNGHELALRIRKTRPDIKIMILSAGEAPEFPSGGQYHDFLLFKPVDPDDVLSMVALLVRQYPRKQAH